MRLRAERIRHGSVVFVDQDDGLRSELVHQCKGQDLDASHQIVLGSGLVLRRFEEIPDGCPQLLLIQEMAVGFEAQGDGPAHAVDESLVRIGLGIAESEVDHRECVPVPLVLRKLRYLQSVEPCVPFVPDVEEGVQHSQVRGLPEPAGADEQVYA